MRRATLLPLLPRLTVDWARREPDTPWLELDGTMAFADISGFSRLSERLGDLGPSGTEELTDLINSSFEGIIGAAAAHGGDVLKIVGDGVLVWFEGDAHEVRAAAACHAMHGALSRPLVATIGRPVRLHMSAGAHTGRFTFVLAAGRHRELVVGGAAASEVLRCEKIANPGQTVVSDDLAARLPPGWVGPLRGSGRLLRRRRDVEPTPPPRAPGGRAPDLASYVPEVQRELLLIAAPGEHRQCAVGFVSLRETDHLLAADGPTAFVATVDRITAAIDAATQRWGTQYLSSDNAPDAVGFMLTAGVPTSSGHDEERLLRTVRQIVDDCAPLDVRAGMHRGRIYSGFVGSAARRGFTAVGDAVNLSARLMQGAGRREIVASRAILDWSDTRFLERPLEPFRVRNRVAIVEASVVGEVAERKPRGTPHDLPFVGRQLELAALERAADAALEGHGTVMVLLGDAGIGKSRLIAELQRVRHDLVPVDLAADEYSSTVPYSLVRTLLGRLAEFDPDAEPSVVGESLRRWVAAVAPDELPWLPLLATVLGGHTPPTRETDELAEEFRGARLRRSTAAVIDQVLQQPTLVVVDDAQWVDDASAELLAQVVDDISDRPRLVCLLVSGHTALPWAPDATILDIQPLDEAAVRELAEVASTGRLDRSSLDRLAERSDGNPLFLANLVDAAERTGELDTLPSTIESLITRRIDDLAARDRVTLREAAVAGMDVELPLLARVIGPQHVNRADVWRRLSTFLGRAGPGHLRFQHGLYQRVAYEGLSFRRRREIHLGLAEELERGGAEPAVLSLHYFRGEDHERAFQWSSTAARAAQRSYANSEAAELYRRALVSAGRTPSVSDAAAAELAEALGDVLELAADYAGAADAYDVARRAPTTSVGTTARLHRKLGVLREHAGQYAEALRRYRRAIRLLATEADSRGARRDLAELSELELAYAGVRYRQGHFGDARTWAASAIEHAKAAADDVALGHAYYLLTAVDVALGETRPASGEVALELLERAGDLVQQANLYCNLGFAAYFAGDWDSALDLYGRSRELGTRSGDLVLNATLDNNIGEILSDRGQHADAIDRFEEALEAFEIAGYAHGVAGAIGNLGRAALRSGDIVKADRLLRDALQRFESISASSFVAETLVRLGECAIAAERPEDALAAADQADRRLRATPDPHVAAGIARVRTAALLAAGRLTEAIAAADDALARARQVGATFEQAQALAVRAEARRALADAAIGDEQEAAALFARLGVPASPNSTLT